MARRCTICDHPRRAEIDKALVTNDADSGISSSNTYTHAIDFNNSGGGATINGVVFTAATGNTGNFTRTVANGSINNHNGTGEVTTSGNLADLMQGFLYNSGPATDGSGLQTYTITGLTMGTTYDLRLYNHAWTAAGNRPNELVFDVGGADEARQARVGPGGLSGLGPGALQSRQPAADRRRPGGGAGLVGSGHGPGDEIHQDEERWHRQEAQEGESPAIRHRRSPRVHHHPTCRSAW